MISIISFFNDEKLKLWLENSAMLREKDLEGCINLLFFF